MNKPGFQAMLVMLFLFSSSLSSAVPPLERELNLNFKNEEIKSALSRIEQQAGVVFSYNPSVINGFTPVTAVFVKKSVREALFVLFKDKVSVQTRNNYIILKEKPPAKAEKKTKVSGYVYEEGTGNKLSNVSIYDPKTLRSATSDEYGYYEISVPSSAATLAINKAEYRDTTVIIEEPRNGPLTNISISTVTPGPDTTEWNKKMREISAATKTFFRNVKSNIHTLNVRDTITRDWQVSFLPFIGTNHTMSGNVYNRVSVNVLGGYSRGNTGFEAGGLFNVNRENMSGAQVAGLFNIVGDSAKGFQAAGLLNIDEKEAEGVQVAGLMNITKKMKGFSAAGLLNITKAGEGVLVAGLANISDTLQGFEAAGLFNVNAAGRGRQVAGLFNTGGKVDLQVAGLFNAAKQVKGVQVALLNFADSSSGVPIGFLSFVKTGVHQLEFSGDELFYANVAFRTGVHQFYNYFSAGYSPGSSPVFWQVGYGVGSSFRMTSRLRGEINFSAHHISEGPFLPELRELLRFYPALEFRFGKKICLAAGPTFNVYFTDEIRNEFGPAYINRMPFNSAINGDKTIYTKGWIGAKLSLRFF